MFLFLGSLKSQLVSPHKIISLPSLSSCLKISLRLSKDVLSVTGVGGLYQLNGVSSNFQYIQCSVPQASCLGPLLFLQLLTLCHLCVIIQNIPCMQVILAYCTLPIVYCR